MKVLKTVSNRTIKVSSNKSKRTFTLKTESGKYKTLPLNKEDFNSCLYNTGQDWQEFLRTENYYKIS